MSFSSSQFDEHVDNYNGDVLDLQQRGADCYIGLKNGCWLSYCNKSPTPEWKRGRSASAVWNWFTDDESPLNA